MKTNSDASKIFYLELDVHKEETVIAILESERDAQPRHYGSIATTRHSLRLFLRLNPPHSPTIKPSQIKGLRTIRFKLCPAKNFGKKLLPLIFILAVKNMVLRQLCMTFLANLEIAALEISTKTGFEADI